MTAMANLSLPALSDVEAAAQRLEGVVIRTPLLECGALNARVGRQVFIKPENLQTTGSFKLRGAYNALSSIPADARAKGVAAFSSGNHAQGVARASKILGMPAAIVMPHDAPALKAARARADGAEIIGYDRYTENREVLASELASSRGAVLVPSYDHPDVIAGQGTVGLEIVQAVRGQGAALSGLYCCVGGGGLIAGIGLALKAHFPDAALIACEPQGFDDHDRSLKSGRRETNKPGARSICDALLAPTPGEMTWALNKRQLTGVVSVSDEEIKAAMRFAFTEMKLVLEPGGAAALAAVLRGVSIPGDQPIAIVLTGGNADPAQFAEILKSG